MPKEILIVKNFTSEGPGLMEHVLRERLIPYTIVDLHANEDFPDPKKYGAIVVMGGPDSANDENDKMHHEFERVRKIVSTQVPYLGICLGLQVLVKATGGSVVKNPIKEIGFRDPENNLFSLELTEEGKKDPPFLRN